MTSHRSISEVPGALAIEPGDGLMRPLKASELFAREIVRDIVTRGLHTGDRLPSEAAMLLQYGFSRESLREGLRLLEVQGMIVIRRGAGGGPIVGSIDPANLGRTTALYYRLAGATYRELHEAWRMAESLLAEQAARNDDSLARLEAMAVYLRTGSACSDELDIESFVQVHTRFHGALASLARNRVLELSLQTMGVVVSRHIAIADDPRSFRNTIEHDHRVLAEAIVAGHPLRARTLMAEHIGNMTRSFTDVLGDFLDDVIEWD